MSSPISRFMGTNSMSFFKPNEESVIFKPISITPLLKNKEYAWNLHGRSCRNLQNLGTLKNLQTRTLVRQSNVNPPPEDPHLPISPSGSLGKWIAGIVLTFILPFFTHKWGSLLFIKNKVDQKIETTENVLETIENVAEKVDGVIDNITDHLPKHSQLKKTLERVDEIAEGVAKSAHVAEDIINKVEEAEDQLESLIHHENSNRLEIPQDDKQEEDQQITKQEEGDKNRK